MGQKTGTLHLDRLQNLIQVSDGKAWQLMETCVWCLVACNHANGVSLKVVEENTSDNYSVLWPDSVLDIDAIMRSYNQDDATEDGAEAIAFMVAIERTTYTTVERASTKTGIDYWLGYKGRHPNNPFHRAGRLEVSGIMIENASNSVEQRIRNKLKQTVPTDHTFPVYVIVVEFSQPYAKMVLKNVNS